MAGPQSIRYVNEVRTLGLLLRAGTISRASLSKMLGISPSTMTKIVTDLIGRDLVRESADIEPAGSETRSAGRPGIGIALNGQGAFFLGVEIGVRRLNFIALDLTGKVVASQEIGLDVRRTDPGVMIGRILAFLDQGAASGVPRDRILGCGVSIPALVDHDGTVEHAPIIGWKRLPLGRLLSGQFGEHGLDIRIEVVNDASALAMAETALGTGKRCRTVLFMNMENGVGGAIVDNDRLFGGNDGFAGEIGHLPVTLSGGTSAQLEDLIGEDAVLGLFERHGCPCGDVTEAIAALATGNASAIRAAGEWAGYLADGLVSIVNVLNPGLVVLGGRVAPIFPFVAERVTEILAGRLVQGLPRPQFEISSFGNDGPAIGAAQLVRQHLFQIDQAALV